MTAAKFELYNITREVNHLLEYRGDEEEKHILSKSVALKDICFPKVYQDFSRLDSFSSLDRCTKMFSAYMDEVVLSGCLIIDALIESDYLGDWKTVILDTINEMAEVVFYKPDEIDYTITPESQEAFEDIISAPVDYLILMACANHESWQMLRKSASQVEDE